MAKEDKVAKQIKWINIVCISAMVILAAILAIRFSLFEGGCPSCFGESLPNRVLVYVLSCWMLGYIASIPVMIHKVKQSKKDDSESDGGFSY